MDEARVLTKADWNRHLEELIKKEGEQCETFFWLHNKSSIWATRRNNIIQIPAILLASITGFLSATSDLLPPVAIGAMSLTVGALNTINSYFKYSQRAESHRISAQMYLKAFKRVETELALPKHQRSDAQEIFDEICDSMSRISEVAPDVPEEIITKYKHYFKDRFKKTSNNASLPIIVAGPDTINVCRDTYIEPIKQPGDTQLFNTRIYDKPDATVVEVVADIVSKVEEKEKSVVAEE